MHDSLFDDKQVYEDSILLLKSPNCRLKTNH